MLPLFQIQQSTTRRHESALANTRRIHDYSRFVRAGRAHDPLEWYIEAGIQGGPSAGRLTHEYFAVLHRVAE
jgi:hypothetical protein